MKLRPESVRWRLTLWYAALVAIPLILFGAGTPYLMRRVLVDRADWFVQEARASFITELGGEFQEQHAREALADALRDVHFRDIVFFVFDDHGRRLLPPDSLIATLSAGSEWIPDPAKVLALRGSGGVTPVRAELVDADSANRVIIGDVSLRGTRYTVAAVQAREGLHVAIRRVELMFVIVVPLFLIFATLGGYVLARRALAPVALMSRHARAISATTLHERLPVSPHHDELSELATLVNELLQRLESAFEQQRRFVANASHELRTPVAIVRAESEIALGREGRPEADYRESLRVVRDTADRMSNVVNDLFLLARADAGHMPVRREPLYLDEIVSDVARSMRGPASQAGVAIEATATTEAPLTGDLDLLSRMLLNLLDNAVKYSPRNSTVRVQLTRERDAYRLRVADEGHGIPVDAQPHIFDRFYRADKARTRADGSATSGAGLGLAIVKLVAEAHDGRAELVRSSTSGSEFAVTLPLGA